MQKIAHQTDTWRDIVLENALDAVIGIDSSSSIIDWNKHAEIIFGWKRNEVIGKKITVIIPEKFRDAHNQGMARFLKTGIGPILNQRIELEALHRDGHLFPIELTVIPLTGPEVPIFYSFVRDITIQKRLTHELQEAIKARDEFISICSHELKTPITAMSLTFQLAEKQLRDDKKVFSPKEVKKRINLVNRHIEKMVRLVDDMLDVSRIATGNMSFEWEEIDFKDLLHETLAKFQDEFEAKKIEIKVEVKDGNTFIQADKIRIEQVITNLISNAIKYGEGNPIHFTLSGGKTKVLLSIKDFGRGVSEENLNRIFHRFERAVSPDEISGLGLGLFICQQIVRVHHGLLYAESELDKGSTFTLELPVKLDPSLSLSQRMAH